MAYTFEQVLAVDPSNPANVARAASITIFAPGDAAKTPLTLTDTNGSPLPNPLTVNANGFGPAFMHATLDRVAWEGGGFTGFLTSYEGMKEEATDARTAAEQAAANAAEGAKAELEARIAAGEFKGDKGEDGANVLPTDTAIRDRINDPASATRGALTATFGAPTSGFQDFIGRIRTGIQDVNMLLLGDSTTQMTGSWSYGLGDRLAALFPTHTVIRHMWTGYLDAAAVGAWAAPVTVATGTGPRTIHIWNGGMPGKSWNYMLDKSRARELITTPNPDVILFNNGHNEAVGGSTAASWNGNRDRAVIAIERVRTYAPAAQVVLMGQNPYVDANGVTLGYSEWRTDIYRRYAAERGYGFIDGCTPFFRDGRALSTLIDGPHPNDAGHLVWLNEIMRHFTTQPTSQTIPIAPPLLERTERQLITNGDFADFGAPPTLPSWTATNATLSHNAAITETKQYSLKITKAASGAASSIRSRVTLPMAMVAGKWVTLAVRMYIPTGAPADTGQIQLRDQSVVIGSGSTYGDVRDQWFWATLTAQIPTTSTFVDVYINNDPNAATDTRNMSVDRVSLVFGRLPIDTATGPGGAAVITVGGVIASDTFTRADSATTLGTSDTGQVWQALTGTWGIIGNQAYTPTGALGVATLDTGSNSHQASIKLTVLAGAAQYTGIVARCTDANNYYWADAETGGGIRLYKRVAGVNTSLGTASGYVAGDVLSLLVTGSTLILKRNSTTLLTVTDTALPNGNLAGLRQGAAQTAARWDDFEARAV